LFFESTVLFETIYEHGGLILKSPRSRTKYLPAHERRNGFDFQRHRDTCRNDLSSAQNQQGRTGSMIEVVFKAKRGRVKIKDYLTAFDHIVVVVVTV